MNMLEGEEEQRTVPLIFLPLQKHYLWVKLYDFAVNINGK